MHCYISRILCQNGPCDVDVLVNMLSRAHYFFFPAGSLGKGLNSPCKPQPRTFPFFDGQGGLSHFAYCLVCLLDWVVEGYNTRLCVTESDGGVLQ